jgi:DNA-binding transcriptional MerR regulator
MLRHYDGLGLLPPAHVDAVTGYRSYEASQLMRLNQIVALKDLGFTLSQVQSILDEKVSGEELRGMLRLRQAELASRIAEDNARLRQIEARLRSIEREGAMPVSDVQIKPVSAIRVAELTALAPGFDPTSIGPVVGPLYDELCRRLEAAGVQPAGAPIAYYDERPDGILVHAAMPVNVEANGFDFEIVDLPEIRQAATIVHHGSMDNVLMTGQELARWIDASDYKPLGLVREVYLQCTGDQETWVTELQEAVEPG